MPHDTPLISTIVAALVLAYLLGIIANRLKMPPLVGYLLAGIFVGPHTPGFVADQSLAQELAEIGVILLMFGVGLHFSLRDLLSVRAVAIPGAIGQIAGATAMGVGLAMLLGWSVGGGLIFGLALSVASTVVLLKAMQDRHMLDSDRGRIAVGWLIVEDLAMVLALVLIPTFAGAASGGHGSADPFTAVVEAVAGVELGIAGALVLTAVKLVAFVGFMLVVGRRLIPLALHYTAHTGSRELFRLAVLAIALGVAAGAAYVFGVSLALGAFFAGMILSESELSHRAAEESLPLRDAFSVLFFVAVGMLVDPAVILRDPLPVLATVLIIVVGKSLLAFAIVLAFRLPVTTAITVAVSLAQIGEFSFILASLGVELGLMPESARDLILGGAIVSIILNPVAFWAADRFGPRLQARLAPAGAGEVPVVGFESPSIAGSGPEGLPRTGHTILIGYGRVGAPIAEKILAAGDALVLIEDAEDRVRAARDAGIVTIEGNGATPGVLQEAGIDTAKVLFVAIPIAFEAAQAVEQGRRASPGMVIVVRAHSEEEAAYLRRQGADHVIIGEREIGLGMWEQAAGTGRHHQNET